MSKSDNKQQLDTYVSREEVHELRNEVIELTQTVTTFKAAVKDMAALLLNSYERIRILESKNNQTDVEENLETNSN